MSDLPLNCKILRCLGVLIALTFFATFAFSRGYFQSVFCHLSFVIQAKPVEGIVLPIGGGIYDRTIVFESAAGGLGFASCSSALLDRYFWSDR
jgi:hypothetical protein